jgi:hypothetical protein
VGRLAGIPVVRVGVVRNVSCELWLGVFGQEVGIFFALAWAFLRIESRGLSWSLGARFSPHCSREKWKDIKLTVPEDCSVGSWGTCRILNAVGEDVKFGCISRMVLS